MNTWKNFVLAICAVVSCAQNGILPDFCGRRPTPRIIGGRGISPQIWPWIVTVRTDLGYPFCGGSLITNQHVLTAAHCLQPFPRRHLVNMIRIAQGIFERKVGDFMLRLSRVFVHPNFKVGGAFYNDLAILKLQSKLDYVIPVCLPGTRNVTEASDMPELASFMQNDTVASSNEILLTSENGTDRQQNDTNSNDTRATEEDDVILGWGRTKKTGETSQTLQQTEVNILNNSLCSKAYPNDFNPGMMLCLGQEDGGRDACQGDSGGPLLRDGGGTWEQIGIISFGFDCGLKGFPGVYTNVSRYTEWIKATIAED